MKSAPNLLKIWLPIFLCVATAPSVQATPTGSVTGTYSVAYRQTTSGTTAPGQYTTSIGVVLNDFGAIDPSTHFPTSVSFVGSTGFPGGQLDVAIPYNVPFVPTIQGPNHFGVVGGGTYGTTPFAGGYVFGVAGVWSQNLSDVAGPLTATFNGGALDGFTQTIAPFDVDLLPNVPLFTLESLEALGNITGNQDITLSLVQPFSPGFSTRYGISEFVNGAYAEILTVDWDPVLYPTGFNIPGSILLAGHDYAVFVSQSTPQAISNGTGFESYQSYQSYNSVAFSVALPSVPEPGATLALLGSTVLCLSLVRRRLASSRQRDLRPET